VPTSLCDDAHALCDEAEAGRVPGDEATYEVRAMLGGLALRAQGIGEQCCRIADVLLADLAARAGVVWAGRTVPGGEDRANARTGLVELRFPAADFWAIPAVAHEMGHVLARAPQLGPKLGSGNPARRVIDEGSPALQREELFCDFYATYVLGPAFPAFMILERLDPSQAAPECPFPDEAKAADTHPPPDKRVLVMLQTLALLDRDAPLSTPHLQARKCLAAAWDQRLSNVGKAAGTATDAEKVVQHFVRRLWHELPTVLGSRFTTPVPAQTLVDDLHARGAPAPDPGVRVLDVVAAAWRARTANPLAEAALRRVTGRALTFTEIVIKRADKQRGERV
jgi:hypothetical protein